MSRSGYGDYDDYSDGNWAQIRYQGAVASATRGKRGQKLLCDLRDALDAMPVKRLIAEELVEGATGEVCALGALGARRGIDLTGVDPEDPDKVAGIFDIATPLVREIVYANDEGIWDRKATPEARWQYMRDWVEKRIQPARSKGSA